MANGGDGGVRTREREQRGIGTEGETRESEGGSREPRGVADVVQGDERKQEVAEQGGGGARGASRCPSSWQGGRRQGKEVGWAGWAGSGGLHG